MPEWEPSCLMICFACLWFPGILVAVLFKIGGLNRVVWWVLGTKRMTLKAVWYGSIVIEHPVASIPFWVVRPGNKLIPVPTLENLTVSNVVRDFWRWHGSIICFAHNILSETIQAVMNVRGSDNLFIITLIVDKGSSHQFLGGNQQFVSVLQGLRANLPDNANYGILWENRFLFHHPMETGLIFLGCAVGHSRPIMLLQLDQYPSHSTAHRPKFRCRPNTQSKTGKWLECRILSHLKKTLASSKSKRMVLRYCKKNGQDLADGEVEYFDMKGKHSLPKTVLRCREEQLRIYVVRASCAMVEGHR